MLIEVKETIAKKVEVKVPSFYKNENEVIGIFSEDCVISVWSLISGVTISKVPITHFRTDFSAWTPIEGWEFNRTLKEGINKLSII